MKKGKSKWIILAVILVGIFVAANSFLVVTYPNEYTVIKQFGKIVDIRQTPGLSMKIPIVQTAEKIENEVLLYDLAVSDVMTKDKKSHPERMETKKYCRFCKKHTLHKETK